MAYKTDLNKKNVKEKIAKVKETVEDMKNYKTVALISLDKLPDSLFQNLRKSIREDGGKVKVLRKAVITRVLESDPKLKEKVSVCERPVALVLTNWTPYELNKFVKTSKKKRAAKAGEKAPSEIIVPEGETDLPPGPALSELKAGGVNVQIKAGKIVVAKDSTIAKAGDVITPQKAKALQTLGVMPFETTARLVFGYDGEYSYEPELLDMGDTINGDLQSSLREAFNLSVNADYPTSLSAEHLLQEALRQALNTAVNGDLYSIVTVDELLLKALREGKALSDVSPEEKEAPKEEKKEEEKKEETPKKEEAPKAEEKPKEEKPEEKKEEAPKAEEKPKEEPKKEEPKKEGAPKKEKKPKEKKEEAPKAEEKPKEEPKKEEKPSEKKEEKPAEEKKPKKAPKAGKKENVKKE